MKKLALIIVIITGLLLLSSCAVLGAGGTNNLIGTSWTLVSYGEKTLLPGTAMTAEFESGEISGSASCNHYFGEYSIKGNQIGIENLGWTEMACMDPEGIMVQEQDIMRMLADATNITFLENELTITSSDGKILVFAQIPGSD